MNNVNINILAEAKQEYTSQLQNLITPQVYMGIKSMYNVSNEFCKKTNDKNVLKKFQSLLRQTPQWSKDKIENEFKRIEGSTKCEYLEDLITALFVTHTKVLTLIKLKNKSKTIEVDVPTGAFFIHKVYIECARNFWKYPYLFHNGFANLELQRNLLQSENLIKESIIETIRKMLPVKDILKEYLGNDYNDDDENEDITSSISNSTKNNIRKLIKLEIQDSLNNNSKPVNNDFDNISVSDKTLDGHPRDKAEKDHAGTSLEPEVTRQEVDTNDILDKDNINIPEVISSESNIDESKNLQENDTKSNLNQETPNNEITLNTDLIKVTNMVDNKVNLTPKNNSITATDAQDNELKLMSINNKLEKKSFEEQIITKNPIENNVNIEITKDSDDIESIFIEKKNDENSREKSYDGESIFIENKLNIDNKQKLEDINSEYVNSEDVNSEDVKSEDVKSVFIEPTSKKNIQSNLNHENAKENFNSYKEYDFEPKLSEDEMSMSKLQSMDEIRGDITERLENNNKSIDSFSFFEDAANF